MRMVITGFLSSPRAYGTYPSKCGVSIPPLSQVNFAGVQAPVNFELKLRESPMLQRWQQAQGSSGSYSRAQAQQALTAVDQALETPQAGPSSTGQQNNSDTLLLAGSLSPGLQSGRQADSGPDMRFAAGGPGGGDITSDNGPGFGGGLWFWRWTGRRIRWRRFRRDAAADQEGDAGSGVPAIGPAPERPLVTGCSGGSRFTEWLRSH